MYFHYLKQQRTCLRIIIWQSGDLPLLISQHSCARLKIRSYRISNYLMQHTQPTGNLYFDALCAQKYLNNRLRVPGFIYRFTTFSRPWITLKGATRHAHVFPVDLRTYATTVWPPAIKFGIRHVWDGRVYYTVKYGVGTTKNLWKKKIKIKKRRRTWKKSENVQKGVWMQSDWYQKSAHGRTYGCL